MEAYLDNSATTRCSAAVRDIVIKTMTEDFGNPSSMHQKGVEAEKYVRAAASAVAKTLRCKESEIVFTSGGTESNNLALIGAAMANKRAGRHIITTDIEHPSVENAVKYLAEEGFEVTHLSVDENGVISLKELENAVREDTILVSIMMVNNEIGTAEPVAEAAKIVHEKNPGAVFHTDAVQAYGKYRIAPKKTGIDLLSASGHKIHGPKGVGFLYIREKTKIRPILFGGGQQKGMRSGTINVPGIAGLGKAAEEAYADLEEKTERLYELRDYFERELRTMENVKVNSCPDRAGAPHIVSVSFPGVRSEVLLHALEDKQIYVSAGSACASNHREPSSVLKNIGLPKNLQESALRFSFSADTTREELDYTCEALRELLPMLRRYTRR